MKIIYLYDGTPVIVQKEEDYPNESWTETPPPEGIYQPYYFDGDEWIGTSKEDWEAMQDSPPLTPKAIEMLVSKLQLQVMIGNVKTKELEDKLKVSEQTLADAVLKITELENKIGGNT